MCHLVFWRDLRKHCRGINPDFLLIGENWWTNWPDELMDAAPWVKGDVFDAVMHYHWFKPVRAYFNQGDDKTDLNQLYQSLDSLYNKYRPSTQGAMMNLVSSHDSERALSSFANQNKYKFHSKPAENKSYFTGKPDTVAYQKFLVLLLHQFTFKGAPHIWNGDEMGMWGADDPDNRKPMWWQGMEFENESPLYPEQKKYSDQPQFNEEVFNYYKALCKLRNENKVLAMGNYTFDRSLVDQDLFSYSRTNGDEEILVIINATNQRKTITKNGLSKLNKLFEHRTTIKDEEIQFDAYSGIVLKKS